MSLIAALRLPAGRWRGFRRVLGDASGPFPETALQQLRITGRLAERTVGKLPAISLQRSPADSRLPGESVPPCLGTLSKRPEEHSPVQQFLGAARERYSLPPVTAERVGRKPQAGCQLGDRRLGTRGEAVAGEIADALDGRGNRSVRRARGEHPTSQQPERIVIPGFDLGKDVDQSVVDFFGPHHVNSLRFDPAKPLKSVDCQRRDHDARRRKESPARHSSEPLYIRCGASAQTDDSDICVAEEHTKLTTGRRGFQPDIREQPFNCLPKGARFVIQRDHGAPSRIARPQGHIRLTMQRAYSQYNDLICELAVAKSRSVVAKSCISPGKAG